MRPVLLDPELLALAFIKPNGDARRLLGLLAYGRWSQYVELLADAEEGRLDDESRRYGGFRGGPSHYELLEEAREHKALIANRLPVGAPDDLVLASSQRIHEIVGEEVDRAREFVPSLIEFPDAALTAQRLIAAHTAVLIHEDQVRSDPPSYTGSRARDRLVAEAMEAGALIVTENKRLASDDPYVEPETGREATAMMRADFVESDVNRYPFDLGAVPTDIFLLASRSFQRSV